MSSKEKEEQEKEEFIKNLLDLIIDSMDEEELKEVLSENVVGLAVDNVYNEKKGKCK